MNKLLLTLTVVFLCFSCTVTKEKTTEIANSKKKTIPVTKKINFDIPSLTYPETRQDNSVVDDYHGTQISDPYRWLEDDNSEETKDWVIKQNAVTNAYLSNISYKKDIEARLAELWDYTRYSSPFKEGEQYYYYKNDGLQNQSVLYSSKSIKSDGDVFLDPNKFSEDGTASLGGMSFNKAGDKVAYLVSEGGSDWRTAYVLNVVTKELTKDKLDWLKFTGISWAGYGFYYSRYPEPKDGDELSASNAYHACYYHQLGTNQSVDELIYVDNDNPQRNVYAQTTDDERFLILYISESTSGNAIKVRDLAKGGDLIDIVTTFDNDYSILDSDGDNLLVLTDKDAPKKRVVSINVNSPDEKNWKTIIAESDKTLRNVSIVGGKLFVNYMENASTKIQVHDMDGKYLSDLELPGIGTSGGVSGKKADKVGFYSYTSYTSPSTIYKLDTETMTSEVFRKPDVDFDDNAFETKQVWYTSKDGTKVPMFILTKLPFLENGGIYVVANLRGGGEFGSEWHKAGTLGEKQNVFDDFIAAAEYLIDNKYTSSNKLAIEGGSNGGLLVGACMTQRPELFQVAFPRVGVLDMLRYHEFTIGWAWAGDYGRSDDPEAFEYLIKYSPLHNLKKVDYPATMVMTADHDDRVVPAHSFKYTAELQKQHTGSEPVIIRIETSAGHGAGKPTSKAIEEAADALSFMLFNMKETYTVSN